jgi:hypothetical protein
MVKKSIHFKQVKFINPIQHVAAMHEQPFCYVKTEPLPAKERIRNEKGSFQWKYQGLLKLKPNNKSQT